MPAAASNMTPAQANFVARQAVLAQAIEMHQSIFSTTLSGTIPGQVVNVPIRNVGLLKRLVVEVNVNVAQGAAETQTLQTLGPSNIFSQVVLTDLSNQTRVNTAGWHLHLLATARRQAAFGAAFTNDSPILTAAAFGVIKAPASVTTSVPVRMFYEIPIAYSDVDLRGAIYANVVNATMNLQLTVNPNFYAANATTDTVLSVYKSSTAQLGVFSSFNINVYQVYLDQLPQSQNGPILPILDLSTAYLINNTVVSGLVANQDIPVPYANFREFMSTCLIYDNTGVLNAGTDINYFALQSANYTNIFKMDPFYSSLLTRNEIGDDFPVGGYYFNHRRRPISTLQYGNMQLVVNPLTVTGVGSFFLIGYEALAIINMVTQAGSLYAS